MIWITKYRHNKIVERYEELLKQYKEQINRKDKMEEIMDKLTDKVSICESSLSVSTRITAKELMSALPDTVPVYVEDYFGGKVIKQEATPVTILDKNGKATYGLTARKAEKNKLYILHHDT